MFRDHFKHLLPGTGEERGHQSGFPHCGPWQVLGCRYLMLQANDCRVYYRTRTYIAGDWDHDKDAVEALYWWNESSRYGLSFSDAHELKQARDTSLNCSI